MIRRDWWGRRNAPTTTGPNGPAAPNGSARPSGSVLPNGSAPPNGSTPPTTTAPVPGPGGVAAELDHSGSDRRRALRQRFSTLSATLGGPVDRDDAPISAGGRGTAELLTELTAVIGPDPAVERIWLLLAVLTGNLPTPEQVRAAHRAAALDGPIAAIVLALQEVPAAGEFPPVTVVADRVVVDVHNTAQADFVTGIQRVTREATRRWTAEHRPLLIGWRPDLRSIRALSIPEARRACWGGPAVPIPAGDAVIVPWNCTYLLPELAAEVTRTAYLQALAQYSTSTLNIVGYDLVPMTTAETSHIGLIPGFSRNLAAARYARTVVPISAGAAGEYLGWREMLTGTGLAGPEIVEVVLPGQAPPADPAATRRAVDRLTVGGLPMVLVVGSHEPRKNHLAVLHAAELLWREDLAFSLTFIGGNSWNSEWFQAGLKRAREAGRPVETLSAVDDDLLFGAYRCARFTVFPSINEGFGLPVAESLACGTPVITSRYGSLAEIAQQGGVVLVDPRDDHDIAAAMRSLLTDDARYAELAEQARTRPERTWDTYARDSWAELVAPRSPRTLTGAHR